MTKYDFLIVGAGLFGATCARILSDKGYKCLVMERENVVGGLCVTTRINDIDVHYFGAHVFNTNNKNVWDFVNKFATFNKYQHNVLTLCDDKLYHMPINMNTFNEIYGVQFPSDAAKTVDDEVNQIKMSHAINAEELAIMNMGTSIYNKLVRPYTKKLWGAEPSDLPVSIIERLPIRYNYNNDYFDAMYEGIPDEGYTKMIENMLGDDVDVILNKDFLSDIEKYKKFANTIIYTGPIDEFCKYIYGPLSWNTLKYVIRNESDSTSNIIGVPVLTIADEDNDMLQMIEHKWLTPYRDTELFNKSTVVSYVYKETWDPSKYCMYPVENKESIDKFNRYLQFCTQNYPNILFGGRAGVYKQLNMSETIELAMGICEKL